MFDIECEEVHVSCTFSWDRKECARIAASWEERGYNTRLGGPAFGDPGGEFTPGLYLAQGYTITSRGCTRKCPFCLVPKREGPLRELTIQPGNDILDNNLLACSDKHIEKVCEMLEKQPRAARFTGGLDKHYLLQKQWFMKWLGQARLDILYLAYDKPSDRVPVIECIKQLRDNGLSQRQIGCYVLVGDHDDNPQYATERLTAIFQACALPRVMFYRSETSGAVIPRHWRKLVKKWSRPAIIFASQKNAI